MLEFQRGENIIKKWNVEHLRSPHTHHFQTKENSVQIERTVLSVILLEYLILKTQQGVILTCKIRLSTNTEICPEMHANEIHELYDRHHKVSPIILILTKTQIIPSNMKSYENDKKAYFI